jgi:hypothetical protein
MTNDPGPADPFRPAPSPAPPDETTWVPSTAPGLAGPTSGAPAGDPFTPHLAPVPPTSPVPAAPPRRGADGTGILVNVLLGIAVVVAVGGVAFAAGRATAPASAAGNGNGRFGNGGGPFFGGPNASGAPGTGGFAGNGGFGGGGLSIEGTVTALSADSITIQLASGQSLTIPIDAQTTYHSRQAATAADVTTGSTVQVQLTGGRGVFNGNGNGNNGNGNGNGGPAASGQPTRTTPAAGSITLVPAGS